MIFPPFAFREILPRGCPAENRAVPGGRRLPGRDCDFATFGRLALAGTAALRRSFAIVRLCIIVSPQLDDVLKLAIRNNPLKTMSQNSNPGHPGPLQSRKAAILAIHALASLSLCASWVPYVLSEGSTPLCARLIRAPSPPRRAVPGASARRAFGTRGARGCSRCWPKC